MNQPPKGRSCCCCTLQFSEAAKVALHYCQFIRTYTYTYVRKYACKYIHTYLGHIPRWVRGRHWIFPSKKVVKLISEGRRGLIQSFTEHSVADASDETVHKVCTAHTLYPNYIRMDVDGTEQKTRSRMGSWPHKNCEEMCTSQLLPSKEYHTHTYVRTYSTGILITAS